MTDHWRDALGYIVQRKKLEESLGFLAAFGDAALASLDSDETIKGSLALCVPYICDNIAVVVLDPPPDSPASTTFRFRVYDSDNRESTAAQIAEALLATMDRRYFQTPRIINQLSSPVIDWPEELRHKARLCKVTALLLSPLKQRGVSVGFIVACSYDGKAPRNYTAADCALLTEAGKRLIAGLEICELHRRLSATG